MASLRTSSWGTVATRDKETGAGGLAERLEACVLHGLGARERRVLLELLTGVGDMLAGDQLKTAATDKSSGDRRLTRPRRA